MAFSLPDHWVWDFWLADDGATYHLFYLHAPHALGNPDLRHRNARIGHATSSDLMTWQNHGQIFDVGTLESSFQGGTTSPWPGPCRQHSRSAIEMAIKTVSTSTRTRRTSGGPLTGPGS